MENLDSTMRAISFDTVNNTEKAINIWNDILTPIQRIELRNKIGADKYTQISRMYHACINHIADNLVQFK